MVDIPVESCHRWFLYSNIFHSNHQRMLPPQVINLLIEPVRLFINQLKVKVEDDSSKN
jgi:hypothetical protein